MRARALLVAILLLSYACGPTISVRPEPQPPTSYTVACIATDAVSGGPVVNAQCLSGDQKAWTNNDGYAAQQLPACRTSDDCGWVTISADNYEPQTIRFKNDHNQDIRVALVPLTPVLPRLQVDGEYFKLSTGERFYVAEASLFHGYQLFLDGGPSAVEPLIGQLESLGFNAVRVFGMYHNDPNNGGIGFFDPQTYGDRYYASLPDFYALLARHHLYGEFTVFADATQAMPDAQDQLAHWHSVIGTLQPLTNVLIEAVNEADQPVNKLASINQLPRPPGVLASHGSNGSQAWPVEPAWDYLTFHTNDAPEEQRKIGHNAMEVADAFRAPVITNETSRAPGKRNWANGREAFGEDSAKGSKLLNAGACYHSEAGKYGRLLDGDELAFARAWLGGLSEIPLDCQPGPYVHRQDLERGVFLRVYQRGTSMACIAQIR